MQASRPLKNSPKIGKIAPYYLNNHSILNSKNVDLGFYIYFRASIKVI